MTLDPGKLAAGLVDAFASPGPDAQSNAARWAAAYKNYAADAVSCAGGSPNFLVAEQVLRGALTAAFLGRSPMSDPAASGLALAFTAFWLLPPVVFSGTTPGAVTAVVGTAILKQAILGVWTAVRLSRATRQISAQAHAAALDVFTRTVVVTHIAPSACIGPIF